MISTCQHSFVKGRSCLTNLLKSSEQWAMALDNGYGVDVLYLDYRKAFDSVPHNRLIYYKLTTTSFNGKLLTWLSSFLADRTMREFLAVIQPGFICSAEFRRDRY